MGVRHRLKRSARSCLQPRGLVLYGWLSVAAARQRAKIRCAAPRVGGNLAAKQETSNNRRLGRPRFHFNAVHRVPQGLSLSLWPSPVGPLGAVPDDGLLNLGKRSRSACRQEPSRARGGGGDTEPSGSFQSFLSVLSLSFSLSPSLFPPGVLCHAEIM